MAVLFRFESDDPIVKGYLSTVRLNAITTWQTTDEFSLEFHSGHLTGFPIYVRPATNRDSSNVPKMDTLNHQASDYAEIAGFANAGKLAGLSTAAKNNLLAIVAQNWAALQELAANYWQNAPVSPDRSPEDVELEAWAAREGADTGQHFEEITRDQLHGIYATKRQPR